MPVLALLLKGLATVIESTTFPLMHSRMMHRTSFTHTLLGAVLLLLVNDIRRCVLVPLHAVRSKLRPTVFPSKSSINHSPRSPSPGEQMLRVDAGIHTTVVTYFDFSWEWPAIVLLLSYEPMVKDRTPFAIDERIVVVVEMAVPQDALMWVVVTILGHARATCRRFLRLGTLVLGVYRWFLCPERGDHLRL